MKSMEQLNMRKIKIHNFGKYPAQQFKGLYFSVIEYKNAKYNLVKLLQSCRGYIGQGLYDIKAKVNSLPDWYIGYALPKDYEYKKGFTYIAIDTGGDTLWSEQLLKSLDYIHEFEKQANVKLSEICLTNKPNVFMIVGSKYWKDSCWKIMLYTFLLKTACFENPKKCNPNYWENLLKVNPKTKETNLNVLLKQIKTPSEDEIFDKTVYGYKLVANTHENNGFNSICSGLNPPMAKALGVHI
jgi:hypothetical protein